MICFYKAFSLLILLKRSYGVARALLTETSDILYENFSLEGVKWRLVIILILRLVIPSVPFVSSSAFEILYAF